MKLKNIPKSESISSISKDIAQVFFAGMFVGSIVTNTSNKFLIILGLLLASLFWAVGLAIAKK